LILKMRMTSKKVTVLLSVDARGFVEHVKFSQQMITATVSRCSQDGATVAKAQEISRVFKDASSLVQSIAEKVGANPQK
jgi:N-glycosylase/DNA lyase